jgi:FtsP/CotA-like multicopper oxidase with cupredoxin domain
MVNDWYHADYNTVIATEVLGPFNPNLPPSPVSDNNLINGKMNANCTSAANGTTKRDGGCTENAGLAKFKFTPGKTHLLRFVNTGSQASQISSIDEHEMTVIAHDFVPVQPYKATVLTIGVRVFTIQFPFFFFFWNKCSTKSP